MLYRRIPRDPNAPLLPGSYEIVADIERGNPEVVTRQSLQIALRAAYGHRISVTDYGRAADGQLIIRFTVHDTPAVQVAWLPLAITAAAVIAALWLGWQISLRLVEFVELVKVTPGAQIGLGGLGLALALVGGALLVWVLGSPKKGTRHAQ